MTHPLIELGGAAAGPLLVLLPANGFPPATYQPMLQPLFATHRAVSLPPRALWPDAGAPPPEPGSWQELAEDWLTGMRQHGLERAIVVGHSFGGVAALFAAVCEPGRFQALVLLDPTLLPAAALASVAEQRAKPGGNPDSRGLIKGALTRRDRFAGEPEAFAYWRSRPLFADWSDAMLRRYTQAMLRPAADGFTLAWPREWEAYYYASLSTDSWDWVPRLSTGIPLLVVRGERSDTFLAESAARLGELLPGAAQIMLPGRGHLFPQSAPGETGTLLRAWLAERGL